MSSLTVFALSGSLRAASTNKGLIRCAMQLAPENMKIITADIGDVPLYNEDVATAGTPEAVRRVLDAMQSADAFLFASTEYNYSMAPALKNMLDWASRVPANAVLNGKHVAIMGAGGGMGTARSQYHLRQVCVYLNLLPLNKPEVFVNAFTGSFAANGDVLDDKVKGQVRQLLEALAKQCQPC
ncbi:MAG: NAD(P)H-dependent oxidoreductase [Desulfovibrionaceae bacterium]|nr:NAD(P)H-dependent oxidoreductase [Desulfovibrionaceae bacterium]